MKSKNIYLSTFVTGIDEAASCARNQNFIAARNKLARATAIMGEFILSEGSPVSNSGKQIVDQLCALVERVDLLAKKQEEKQNRAAQNAAEEVKADRRRLTPEERLLGGSNGNRNVNQDDEAAVFTAMDVPNISFNDVVGLEDVKEAVRDKIIMPRIYPEIYQKLKIKNGGGVLMYGHPGTGKTMIAKAIAHEVKAKFYSIKCSSLNGKYFGEVERNIKALFDTARASKNAVIFLDEFEAIATKRDTTNSSVMKRAVSELLAQLDGVEGNGDSNILCVAATNIPWEIDSAFLRPGRMDERIYISLPDAPARKALFQKSFEGIPLSTDVDLDLLVEKTDGYSPADITCIVNKAKQNVAKQWIKNHDQSQEVNMETILDILKTFTSSVNVHDLEKLVQWRNKNGKR